MWDEAHLTALWGGLECGVVVHDADTTIRFSNAPAQRILGLVDLDGRRVLDDSWVFLDEDGRRLPVEDYPVSRVLSTGRPARGLRFDVVSPSGKHTLVLANAAPVLDADGSLAAIVVSLSDISERFAAVRGLSEMGEALRHAVTTISQPTLVTDSERHLVHVNRAFGDLVGEPADRLLGRRLDEFLPPQDHIRHADQYIDLIRSGNPHHEHMSLQVGPQTVEVDAIHLRVPLGSQFHRLSLLSLRRPETDTPLSSEEWAQAELHAKIDVTTGLLRRSVGLALLQDVLAQGELRSHPTGAVLLRLRSVRQLNSRHGLAGADRVLRDAAEVVLSSLDGDDAAIRLAATQYLAVLPRQSAARVQQVAAALSERARVRAVQAGWGGVQVQVAWTTSEHHPTVDDIVTALERAVAEPLDHESDSPVLA